MKTTTVYKTIQPATLHFTKVQKRSFHPSHQTGKKFLIASTLLIPGLIGGGVMQQAQAAVVTTSTANVTAQSSAGTSSGALTVAPDSSTLTSALSSAAQTSGVVIQSASTQSLSSTFAGSSAISSGAKEVESSYASEASSITSAVSSYSAYTSSLTVSYTAASDSVAKENASIAAANSAAQSSYEVASSAYASSYASAKAQTSVTGNPSSVMNNVLVFPDQPQASVAITANDGTKGTGNWVTGLTTGDKVTVDYSNLKGVSYDGTAIPSISMTYTVGSLMDGETSTGITFTNDPNEGVWFGNIDPTTGSWTSSGTKASGTATMNVSIQFPSTVNLTNASWEVFSLNHGDSTWDDGKLEYVSNVSSNMSFVPITGGTISDNGGSYYSTNANIGDNVTPPADGVDSDWYSGALFQITSGNTLSYDLGVTQETPSNDLSSFDYGTSTSFFLGAKPTAPTTTPEVPAPTKPTPEPLNITPVTYTLAAQPGVTKKVQTTDGKDVNGQQVTPGETLHYLLVSDPLPAGRETTQTLSFTDALPEGFDFDQAATQQASSGYTVVYDTATGVVTFSATTDTLAALNKDLTKDVTVPMPVIVGSDAQYNMTYLNDVTLKVNGYTVTSKAVKDTTGAAPVIPAQPKPTAATPAPASVLPKTGEQSQQSLFALGVALAAAGSALLIQINRRKTKKRG